MKKERIEVRLHGAVGKALKLTCENRLKKTDYRMLESVFLNRTELDNAWRCEFWGKIVRSAILVNDSVHDPELAAIIEETVRNIMAAQTPDGCISSYPVEKQLGGWDIWGRKYVLLGLLRYYDFIAPDEKVKRCCVGMVDHLMSQVGPGRKSILECGSHDGLAASSILGAVVGVYRISGEKRFLDFARYIVRAGCSQKHNIFEAARAGVIPCELGNGKAYEMTSCFQGLAELYRFDPKPEYRETCKKYFAMVRGREIFVTGVAGCRDCWGEYWDDGAWKQTAENYPAGLGETCVTTTWLRYCKRIAGLTHAMSAFDEAERALYNGILGAMVPDGSNWIHVNPTPLTGGGCKIEADDQIGRGFGTPYDGNDCCRAQGPDALALAPGLAVMQEPDGISMNLFEPMTAVIPGIGKIEISGNYPFEHEAEIRVEAEKTLDLNIRIPGFTEAVSLNGTPLEFVPGTRLRLSRRWAEDDRLKMKFDFSVRKVTSPDGGFTAFMRGPLVLAEDSRGNVPEALCHAECEGHKLIDYITAGNRICRENTLKVWFPRRLKN